MSQISFFFSSSFLGGWGEGGHLVFIAVLFSCLLNTVDVVGFLLRITVVLPGHSASLAGGSFLRLLV